MNKYLSKNEKDAFLVSLLNDVSLHSILQSQLVDMGDRGVLLLEKAIKQSQASERKQLLELLDSTKFEILLNKAKVITSKHYFTLEEVVLLLNRILFDLDTKEEHLFLNKINDLANAISKKIESCYEINEIEILELFNEEISQKFIIERENNLSLFAPNKIFNTYRINQITLSLIYLIIAEKINIPIFGIPLDDHIVLCYAQPFCSIHELVETEDILFYFNPGIKDSIYSYYDILEYSGINNLEIIDENLLPKSNNLLIQQWMKKIELTSNVIFSNSKFSSCYQQVQDLIKYS